jgi:hypothetical protein
MARNAPSDLPVESARERCVEISGDEGLLFLDPPETFDRAILGVARRIGMEPIVAYDRGIVLARLAQEAREAGDDDPEQSAIDHYEFNVAGSFVGEKTPIFLDLLEEG